MRHTNRCVRTGALIIAISAAPFLVHAEDPPTFPYDETTTILVGAFAQHLGPWGPQGQPLAHDAEFTKWFVSYAGGAPLRDVNGDNLIDCEDVTGIVVRLLRGLRGDLDGDGAVGPSDVAQLTANLGRTWTPQDPVLITDGDLTGDGAVTPDDLQKLMGVAQGPLDGLDEEVAERFVYGRPDSLCADPNWVAHNTYFSGSWPPPHEAFHSSVNPHWHTIMLSGGPRPPGHYYQLSATWPGSDHTVSASGGSGFPPSGWPSNHNTSMSSTWDDDTGSHHPHTSYRWPSSHIRVISEGWGPPQNHGYHVSLGWGPNHIRSISYSPSVHIADVSANLRPRSPHLQPLSNLDDVFDHGEPASSAWPPSHVGAITSTWAPGDGHHMSVSLEWPGGHFDGVSREWPPHTNPRWPPNHYASTSNGWGQPPPPSPPLWPPEHSYIITIIDIIDVIAGF